MPGQTAWKIFNQFCEKGANVRVTPPKEATDEPRIRTIIHRTLSPKTKKIDTASTKAYFVHGGFHEKSFVYIVTSLWGSSSVICCGVLRGGASVPFQFPIQARYRSKSLTFILCGTKLFSRMVGLAVPEHSVLTAQGYDLKGLDLQGFDSGSSKYIWTRE
ncbi:Hypothetical predicted protein [Octopus vulgaris]|uniref:Uncharacterized protein n=1 Tax=Octopus vulgaris TaxID=6645 RepID=A0AA36FF32_OCTVU|nr:Hypothetical predicted protein [Octopus vulgaris]